MTDTCLALIHEEKTIQIIEKLVNCALPDEILPATATEHFDQPDPLLSDQFVYQLVHDNDTTTATTTMRNIYLKWPNELRIKLLQHYDDVLEIELLNLIDTYTTTITVENDYIPLDELHAQLTQNQLIQLLQASPYLTQQCVQKLANYIIQFKNWKLLRLGQCVHRCLLNQGKLSMLCSQIEKNVTFQHVEAQQIYEAITNYIYAEGPYSEIGQRRNEAWCLAMSLTRFTWYCVYQLVQWCHKENEPWTSQACLSSFFVENSNGKPSY